MWEILLQVYILNIGGIILIMISQDIIDLIVSWILTMHLMAHT
jgi:hypothetical protein